jgi:predicted CopG family antitoxin
MRFGVSSETGIAEIVDRIDSAESALKCVLALIARKRKNIRIFDEHGRLRSLEDLRRLATKESEDRRGDRG